MSSVVLSGDSSGTVTLTVPSVAGTNTATLPASTGTVMVSGNMPAFSAYPSSAQAISTNTLTKILFGTEEFDTNNNFASSTFTPTVAGYYQVSAAYGLGTTNCNGQLRLFKNGTSYKFLQATIANAVDVIGGSCLVYCNGTTDYLEIYCYISVGQNLASGSASTYFQASMVRAA